MATKPSATVKCDHPDNVPPQEIFDRVSLVSVGQGINKKEYQIHQRLFCHHALYSDHAIRMRADYKISWPNTDPAVFDTIVYWMYTGRFWDPRTSKDGGIPLSLDHVLEVYFFAVAEGFEYLLNNALDLIYRLTVQDWTALISAADTIYNGRCPSPILRRFLLDFAVNV